jgi:hypothetical protein
MLFAAISGSCRDQGGISPNAEFAAVEETGTDDNPVTAGQRQQAGLMRESASQRTNGNHGAAELRRDCVNLPTAHRTSLSQALRRGLRLEKRSCSPA